MIGQDGGDAERPTAAVRQLFAVNTHAPSPELIADRLDELAQAFRDGREPATRVVVILDSPETLDFVVYGWPMSKVELIGTMTYLQAKVIAE